MSKMRKTGGYMTVEVSALIPIVLMVLWLFFSYQIVSVHGRSPDLELHAYSACLPDFPVTLPRFVALTVE